MSPSSASRCEHVSEIRDVEARTPDGCEEETGHPIVESFEPGEDWRWCYEDRIYV
ncbi:MAG: hypothetical protein ACLFWG_08375 [Longimicrobiales bacterium]